MAEEVWLRKGMVGTSEVWGAWLFRGRFSCCRLRSFFGEFFWINRNSMLNWSSFNLFEYSDNSDWDVGQHEEWESEHCEDFWAGV